MEQGVDVLVLAEVDIRFSKPTIIYTAVNCVYSKVVNSANQYLEIL